MTGEVTRPAARAGSADERLLNGAGPSLLAHHADDPGAARSDARRARARLPDPRATSTRAYRSSGRRAHPGTTRTTSWRAKRRVPSEAKASRSSPEAVPGIMEAANRGAREAPDLVGRLEHRAALRATAQHVRRPRDRVRALLRPQGHVRALRLGLRRVSRRIRDARRVVRVPDADPDGHDQTLPGAARRIERSGGDSSIGPPSSSCARARSSAAEHDLLHVVDDPDEVCRIVVAAYGKQTAAAPAG